MGNRITRTVLFAASALLSISAFGAGAARFGTLRNADWVVTNAWQAVSNKTHDLIIDLGQEASLPPNWQNVSNAAMNAVQSLQPAYDYADNSLISFSSTGSVFRSLSYGTQNYWTDSTGCVWEAGYRYDDDWFADSSRISQVSWISAGYDEDPSLWAIYFRVDGSIQAQIYSLPPGSTQTNQSISASDWIDQYEGAFDFNIYRSPHEATNLVGRVALTNDISNAISTNNPAFVSAVLAAPLEGADPSDLSELAEYGSYGTVGAALLALIAGLAALKRRMTAEESAVGSKLDGAAAYPAWVQDDYQPPAIVSHKGRLWSCQNYTIAEPGEDPQSDWLEVTIKNLKQDVLTAAQLENIEAVPNKANAADVNAALAGKMPMYPMVSVTPTSGTLTVAPYTVATYTAGSTAAAFEVAVGAGTTGKARDCELVIDCTATGTVAPTVTWPATFHPRTDAGTDFACEAGVRNVYYISEYATGQFAVGGWQETTGGNA